MSFQSYLRRLRRWAKPAAKPRQVRARLGLETLEDRLVPSTVTISGTGHNRVLTYQAYQNEANDLRISFATTTTGTTTTTTYTFEDKGAAIVDANGNFHSSITADGSAFDSIQVNLNDTKNPDNKNDSVTVYSLDKGLIINGGNGNDTVAVGDDRAGGQGMELITQSIGFDGGSQSANGKDKLVVNDRNAPLVAASAGVHYDYGVQGTLVTRQRLNGIGQSQEMVMVSGTGNVEEVDLNTTNQSDTIEVSSVTAGTQVFINAGDGDDKVSTSFNMDSLAGGLFVKGEGGNDKLELDDRLAAASRSYAITTGTVSQGTTVVTMEDTMEGGLTLDAANTGSTIDVQSTTALMPLQLNGGTGRDTVTMSDSARPDIDTYNFKAGSLERWTSLIVLALPTAYVNYSGIDKLVVDAGPGSDTFAMTDTAQPALVLNGGPGVDTIDYSPFASTVLVNMALGYATKVGALGALSNVENANGGSGDDLLVGDDNDNVLRGQAGRDVLIGGKGADQLYGGADQDLMIASDTDFDKNGGWLETIRSTWAGTGTIQDRMSQLKLGVGGVQLSDTTLHLTATADDGAVDKLFGDDDGGSTNTKDWFWANSAQDVLTMPSGDIFK